MPHVLEQKMSAVRRRVRRSLVLDGAGRLIAAALAAAILLGTLDYLVRFEDRGIRFMASLALAGVVGWGVRRYLWPALHARLSNVELAQRLEGRLPILQDRLASAMRFLREREDDALAGSATLRRTVIAEATAEVDRLNLEEVVQPYLARRSLSLAAVAIGVLAALVILDARATGIALARLAAPWGGTQWPKQNHLQFLNPVHRLAAGQTFEVEVTDAEGSPLPDKVVIQYRLHDAESSAAETSEPMRLVNDALVARKENVTRPFAYRAVGGDDFSMDWIELEVVEPPRIDELGVTLRYPDYTGWPPEAAEPHLRALVGTHVELAGRTDKPVAAVKINVDESEPIAARVTDDGRGFTVPADAASQFTVERSGGYWIELIDREGFSSGEATRYEIRAIEDFTPTVTIDQPQTNAFITPAARVVVNVTAKDDLALANVALRFSRSDRSQEDEAEFVLYQGPEHAAAPAAGGAKLTGGETRAVSYELNAAGLDVTPGTVISLYATATDYRPHRGQSQPARLTVITPDELRDRLADRQNFIVSELGRLLKLQRDARAPLADAEIQLRDVGNLQRQDVDHLQSAELIQRQVERGLTSESEGVSTQIAGLLADLRQNNLDSPDVERQMQTLLDEIDRLGRDELPAIGGELTAAIKAAQIGLARRTEGGATAEDPAAVAAPIKEAAGHQDEVIATLERLTTSLTEWDNFRRFHREIAMLRRQQEELNRDSAEAGRRMLAREFNRLTPQGQADLGKLAARQLDLARQFDKIQDRMQQTAEEAATVDPLAAGSVADALSHARERGVSQAMHESGRQIGQNQLGQATQSQRRATDDLQEMLDILANRRERELTRLVKRLREAQDELDRLRKRQEGLQKKWREAAAEANEGARRRELERLTRQERDAAAETQRLARTLERLQAERAGQHLTQGGTKMERAGQQGEQGQASAAADAAAEAQRDLEQAQQELAKRLAQAEADLAQEQVARLEDHLKPLAEAERKLLEETRHYHELEASQGQLTRAQAISVGDMGKQQHELAEEAAALAGKMAATPVFHLALDEAARQMQRAASLLDSQATGKATQEAEQRAVDLLTHAVEALKPAPPAEGPQQPENDSQPGDQNGSGADASQMLAELKLLKWMQDDVNQRTEALDEAYRDGTKLPDEAQADYQELSEQQGVIAELILKLATGGKQESGNESVESD